MTGTVLLFRDDGDRPLSQVALSNGDRIQLVLDGNGLAISWLRPSELSHRANISRAGAPGGGALRWFGRSEASVLRQSIADPYGGGPVPRLGARRSRGVPPRH